MSLYLKQIEQLISLQKVDDEIHSIRQELENAPKELESLHLRFNSATEQRTRQLDKVSHLRDQEKRLSIEIEDDFARIKKSRNKLMTVGNTKEYHAMVREMDSLERVNKNREEELNALREELTRQSSALAEVEAEHLSLENELAACEAGLQNRMTEAQAALDSLMRRRGETGKEVPPPVFARYEFIRERLQHPVIVPVEEGVCSGCNIAIPPQNYIELQKAAQILSCPNCQRLMFWNRHFELEKAQE
ncbi:C4-type zinc ribbon domain-containing protein [Desulfovibrio sp. OttesenSCG-928-A18]|nr:C4-type zinc ribbon domain-containing protein [Desulfovibrio sp. OttesenSCG-928-A18]